MREEQEKSEHVPGSIGVIDLDISLVLKRHANNGWTISQHYLDGRKENCAGAYSSAADMLEALASVLVDGQEAAQE